MCVLKYSVKKYAKCQGLYKLLLLRVYNTNPTPTSSWWRRTSAAIFFFSASSEIFRRTVRFVSGGFDGGTEKTGLKLKCCNNVNDNDAKSTTTTSTTTMQSRCEMKSCHFRSFEIFLTFWPTVSFHLISDWIDATAPRHFTDCHLADSDKSPTADREWEILSPASS